MAVLQFVVTIINRESNADLRRFSRNAVQYLWELMAFIVMAREEKPFPFGPFPQVPDDMAGGDSS
jgi:hypothetical protein